MLTHEIAQIYDDGTAWWIVGALVLIYAASFLVFYPRTITVIDEMSYVQQSQILATGVRTEVVTHPLTGEETDREIKTFYPLGTALTLAPWVRWGGWPLAFFAPALCLLGGVLVTARWLYDLGHSPLASLVVLAYPASLVLGRVCMSEAPSLLVVSIGLWLFFRGLAVERRTRCWLAAGVVAGGSLLFREGNVLLFAPLFAGTLFRRERGWWALLLGGLGGISLRLLSSYWFWGDAFYYKSSGLAFGPSSVVANLPLYAFALVVMVPGGLIAVALYRGSRRPELIATVALFVAFYLMYDYSGFTSGMAKRLILGPRYFIPMLPLLALALADGVPRLYAAMRQRQPGRAALQNAVAIFAIGISIAAVAAAAVGANWYHSRWSSRQAALREAIYENTTDGSVIVSNSRATVKHINSVYGRRVHLDRDFISVQIGAAILRRHEHFYFVLLDRTDSELWRQDARENAIFVHSFFPRPELQLDVQITPTDRLRIYRVSEIRAGF